MKTVSTLFCLLLLCGSIHILALDNPIVNWKFKTNSAIHSRPLIDDTIIYFGSNDRNLYALNKNTGNKVWEYPTPYPVTSTPAINDSLIFIESGFKLYALDKKTGALKWSYVASDKTPELSLGLTDYHHSSPVIYKDAIYYGDGWGNMNGVDIKTGTLKFQYTIITDSAAIRSAPAIQNDSIFFGDWAGHVYAVSLADKSLLWKYTLEKRREYYGMITSEMEIHDSLLYFGSQHDVFSPLNLKTGEPAWTFIDPYQTYLPSTPVFYKNSVIIGSTILAFKVYSLTNGKVNWSFDNTGGIFFVHPVIVDSVVIMNTSNFGGAGTLYMINANNGKLMSEYHFISATPASPVVDDKNLFIGNGDNYFYALDLKKLMYPKDDSSLVMDTVSQYITLKTTDESYKLPLIIENKGMQCDSFYISIIASGNPANKGFVFSTIKSQHVYVAGTYSRNIMVYPQILNPGIYGIDITMTPKRHPEMVFTKIYTIEIKDATVVKTASNCELEVFPNPANECATFKCHHKEKIQVDIYALNGRRVFSYNGNNPGEIIWNTIDIAGNACKTGTYIYRYISKSITKTGSLMLVK